MKHTNIIFALLCLIFVSCGEDRRKEYAEITAPDRWIESVMLENYYWYEDIPTKGLNYFLSPSEFFKKLLSKNDNNYSYLEDPTDTHAYTSYGIEFDASDRYNDTDYVVRVLYVKSNSPAQTAGLKRGDQIIKRNGKYITKSLIDSLYRGDAITLTLGEYKEVQDENGNPVATYEDVEEKNIAASRITEDNPIHFWGTYTEGEKTIGYLVYNHFTSGKNENDHTYDNELRQISNQLKGAGLTHFILDLRYNTGGSLEPAQLLGSILAPQTALGKEMCHLRYNEKQSSRNETILFSTDVLSGGSNLDLKSIYILTGSNTAATSDVLISCLKAYMKDKVIIIGRTTQGNYTGTHSYASELYPYMILHPVDCLIYNPNNSIPTAGHIPTHSLNELDARTRPLYPFGDREEYLLDATISLIVNEKQPTEEEEEEDTSGSNTRSGKAPGFCTLDNIQIRGTSIGNSILISD